MAPACKPVFLQAHRAVNSVLINNYFAGHIILYTPETVSRIGRRVVVGNLEHSPNTKSHKQLSVVQDALLTDRSSNFTRPVEHTNTPFNRLTLR